MRLVSQFQQDGHKNKQKDGLLSRLSALQGHIYTPDCPSASCDEEVGGQTSHNYPPWRAIYHGYLCLTPIHQQQPFMGLEVNGLTHNSSLCGQTTKHTPHWRAIYTRFPLHGSGSPFECQSAPSRIVPLFCGGHGVLTVLRRLSHKT